MLMVFFKLEESLCKDDLFILSIKTLVESISLKYFKPNCGTALYLLTTPNPVSNQSLPCYLVGLRAVNNGVKTKPF